MVWQSLLDRLFRKRNTQCIQANQAVVKGFRKHYAHFRKLIDANAALGDLMADMDTKLAGNILFGISYVRNTTQKALDLTRRMAVSLVAMNPAKHRGLGTAIDSIEHTIKSIMGTAEEGHKQCHELTLSLVDVDVSMVDWVGGKCANLGEMQSLACVPVPRGFAITVQAFHIFMEHQNMGHEILRMLSKANMEDHEELAATLLQIRTTVEEAPLPPALERALEAAWEESFGDNPVQVAVRSSAQSEDGAKSFAGQFLTELNVNKAQLSASYRKVVASLFTHSATLYRMHQGIPLRDNAMAVACIEMVNAVSSGVAYTHNPVNLMDDSLIINGVWGLGRYAVDGIVPPDIWVFTRSEPHELIRRRSGDKDRMLVSGPAGELQDTPVPEAKRKELCLDAKEALHLARLVMKLEKHYGSYQDVEWAKTENGDIIFLQSRPLSTNSGKYDAPKPPLLEQYTLLAEGGDIAYPGIGHGVVVQPCSQDNLALFPEGGILVGRHSSAEYAAVMDRAQAIITETGGITGHMATICREFRVPTVLNLPKATEVLRPGMEITVDAFSGRVYAGLAEELLPLRLSLDPVRLQDTPVYTLLRDVARLVLPLNLIDPTSAKFTPSGCKTLHDIMRYAHEYSYQEMFAISDSAVDTSSVAMKLKATLPIDLHIIDLDNGTRVQPGSTSVLPEEICSAPLKALLGGMLNPAVVFRKPRPINMGGFMSVMGQQLGNPQGGDSRFGNKSYAIISDRYMNFSSRVGYHYSVLDAYCGNTDSKNYISFSFQGGAAGEMRRARRCKAIALVLEALGFSVVVQSDMVKSRYQKYPKKQIEEHLDQLGRLLQVTRQMDMLMVNDASITQFKEDFLNGIYR